MATSRPKPALKAPLRAAVAAVASALTQLRASGMLIGGIAVIARGVPRTTRDVDATVSAESGDVDALLHIFEQRDLSSRIEDARAFAQTKSSCCATHRAESTWTYR